MRSSIEPAVGADPRTDSMLLQAIARGDQEALSELYDRYASAVFGLLLRILTQHEVAEELTQEVFLRVWRRAASFETRRGAVSPWLLSIAHNLAIDELRRQRARPQPVYEEPDRPVLSSLPDQSPSVEREVWLYEQRRTLAQALGQLPNEQREVLDLAYYGGLTQREIAERLGTPLGTVKTRARLGLLKLRDLLEGQGLQLEE